MINEFLCGISDYSENAGFLLADVVPDELKKIIKLIAEKENMDI